MNTRASPPGDPIAIPPGDPIATLVRAHDPDRFLTALFAPPEQRAALLTLYAFAHELARARDVTSEPHLALIRLHWWREVVEGARRRHEVATPLSDLLDSGLLPRDLLVRIIDAHETEAEPEIETLAAWRTWLLEGMGGIAVAAATLLGAPTPESLRPLGAALGAARVVRWNRAQAMRGRCLLPADLLAEAGLTVEEAIAAPDADRVSQVLRRLAGAGEAWLAAGPSGRVPRSWIAAALPAILARRDLRRALRHSPAYSPAWFLAWSPAWSLAANPGPRGLGDRLAVTVAGLCARV